MSAKVFESCSFHLRHAWFNFREQFSDIPAALTANLLIPFFVWILSRVWEKFNSGGGIFNLNDVILYIAITELLYMTFVRPNSVSRASGDFSISLSRPRSWPVMSFSSMVGRSLGGRIIMLAMLLCIFPLFDLDWHHVLNALIRLFVLLPWLAIMQGMFALFFASAQVLWHQTEYFLLPFGKLFLVFGGVWGPIFNFNEPFRSWILRLPPSDLFFQPAYFCVKGEFYQISATTWLLRTAILAIVLALINRTFFRWAKENHQSYGG